MAYHVEVTPRAQVDILEIFEWLQESAPAAAEKWYLGLIEKLRSLEDSPTRCSRAFESNDVNRDVRQLYYGRRRRDWFRALFDIQERTVRVLRVRRCSQRELPPDELAEQGDAPAD